MKIKEIFKETKKRITIIGICEISNEIIDFLKNKPKNLIVDIICESENYIFNKSILSDNNHIEERKSFSEYKFEVNRISREISELYKNDKNLNIDISYVDIPKKVIISDNKIYTSEWIITPKKKYTLVENKDLLLSIKNYLEIIKNPNIGKKFISSYRNNKGKIIETIELFDENRIRRGVYPRSAFYDTDFIKLVVWVYIFDRKGRLLIHKRSENAKDNQGMWDKSVGGHTDYINDIDTSKTVPREVIEELETDEILGSSFIQTNDEDVIFLGEWRPEKRMSNPFKEIENYKDNWVYFRIPNFERTSSPRILPDNTTKNNEVIADTYLFLLSEDVTPETVSNFKNSNYKLLYPKEIKNAIQNSANNIKDINFSEEGKTLKFSPDLIYTFNSKLRYELEQFSNYIKSYFNG